MILVDLDYPNGVWARVYTPLLFMVDFSRVDLTKKMFERVQAESLSPYRQRVHDINCGAFEKYVSADSALESLAGSEQGRTCVLIGSGPSATNIAQRLEPFRDRISVAGLNLGGSLTRDQDYFISYECLAKPEWWSGIDPEKTKLLTFPAMNFQALEKWKGGKNIYYSWIMDMRNWDCEQWQPLSPVISGCTAAVSALHALHKLGFERILLVGFDFSMANPKVVDESIRQLSATFYADQTEGSQSYVSGHGNQVWAVDNGDDGSQSKFCILNQYQMLHSLAFQAACEITSDAGTEVVDCCEAGVLQYPNKGNLESILKEVTSVAV